jgi:DNA-binding Lrp family transcriptional regulator
MTAKRTINAKEVARDIRSHMTDEELMEKYRLSARGLQSVLKKLLESKLITQAEFDWRPVDYDDTVFLDLESPDSKE